MKALEVIHKQLQHTQVLLIEAIRLTDITEWQNETHRSSKRVYLLEQAATVMRWMEDFDPSGREAENFKTPPAVQKLKTNTKELKRDQIKFNRQAERRFGPIH